MEGSAMSDLAELDGPHWTFAVEIYACEGVPHACLTLQDQFGLDVIVLMTGLYSAALGEILSADDLERMDAAIIDWRQTVVHPLRTMRRQLKSSQFGQPVVRLRETIKSAELRSEQIELAMLASQIPHRPSTLAATHDDLRALIVEIVRLYAPEANPVDISEIASPIIEAVVARNRETGQP
ncbi:MAG: TIGR02444 family protein [Pelagibacterium sp.]|nr:TIGR02444 family protein [Pelagibacterium sp.]|tara:strand:+ start:37 stop:579 length:543 start_codon:yes stop_codon:yes gene_type:complete